MVTTKVCPRCRAAGPELLFAGEACASCRASDAWSELGGARLVIDRAMIDETMRQRQGAEPPRTPWRQIRPWVAPMLALGVAGVAVWSLVVLLAALPIGPLAALQADRASAWKHALLAGAIAVSVGVVALVRTRRSSQFRRGSLLACHLVAVAAGATALVIGGLHGLAMRWGFDGMYTSMPPRESLGVPTHIDRILDAAVVILAPDAEGNALRGAIGAGAVVAAEAHRAWIVTCSHVAIPDVTPDAPRRARDARPVWVQLADGREGPATVKWAAPPPLDVVLIELTIDHPPLPVPIALDASSMIASSPVTFVPNPYRSGWKVLHGQVIRRETHHTSAGRYDLVLTDLPVMVGDSGSGLYDARGQLVGINTWNRIGDGHVQGMSLPSEAMRVAIDAIRAGRIDQLEQGE